ncbi:HD domain-containing protein [Virgibacillus ainsalahensis]
MKRVTLEQIFTHPITQKYLKRSGVAHAIAVAEYAYIFARKFEVNPDSAVKAALLHDVGHYTWYRDGEWDYELYKENDIHAIKGASRAHKLLIRIGEDRQTAKEIAVAILLHTDSYLPEGELKLKPLQQVVTLADEADEETGGNHHYKSIEDHVAIERIRALDIQIEKEENETGNNRYSYINL